MIFSLVLLFLAVPAYADLDPFMDEASAARAYEAHINCLAQSAFDHRNDNREPEILAVEVVRACLGEAATLRAALADVYRRKPALIGVGREADSAADHYLSGAQTRVAEAIRHFRNRGSDAAH